MTQLDNDPRGLRSPMFLLAFSACVAPPEDSAAPPSDSAMTLALPTSLEEGGVVTCADPSLRETTPLSFLSSDDWDTQASGTPDTPTGWGVSVADFDGDDLLDAFLPQLSSENELFYGNGDGTFRRADADALPPDDGIRSTGSTAVDYDGDGDLDLFLARHGPDALFANDGTGHFTDVTEEVGIAGPGYDAISAAWGDMDGDGDLDVFVGNYWTDGLRTEPGELGWDGDPNLLWENVDGTFVDRSDRLTTRDARDSFTFIAGWWDVDQQNGPDLFVTSDKRHENFANTMLMNDGTGVFTVLGDGNGLDYGMNSMGLAAGDLNDDQIPDFVVSDWGYVRLFMSLGDNFWYEASTARGLLIDYSEGRTIGWGTELVDLDNDGDDDLPVAFGPDDMHLVVEHDGIQSTMDQADDLFLQDDNGIFTSVASEWGFDADRNTGRGFAAVDLNADGYVDFVRRKLFAQARVDMAACGSAAWLEVELSAPGPNTRGIGARVEVEDGDRRWTKWIHAGSTNISSSSPPWAHFGLGDRDTVDTLRVVWPDGEVQEFSGVTTRQHVKARR